MRPSRAAPGAMLRAACVAAVALVGIAIAGCDREPPPPEPVTSLDDPRLPGWMEDGTLPVGLYLGGSMEEEARWSPEDGEIDLAGGARMGPDIVVARVKHVVYGGGSGDGRYGGADYALHCGAKQARRLSVERDGIDIDGLGDGTRPWPAAGAGREMFEKACDNRFRCESRRRDSPCEYELSLDIERHDRLTALRDAKEAAE